MIVLVYCILLLFYCMIFVLSPSPMWYISYFCGMIWPICAESAVKHQLTNFWYTAPRGHAWQSSAVIPRHIRHYVYHSACNLTRSPAMRGGVYGFDCACGATPQRVTWQWPTLFVFWLNQAVKNCKVHHTLLWERKRVLISLSKALSL